MTGGQMQAINLELFGSHPKIIKSISLARQMALTKNPVLITGEFGVGRKTLGKFIHENSIRKNGPFLIVDCQEDALDVENLILGHRDQSTGKFFRGALENGNGGTVVLDNIDGLNEEFQKKLHKILLELPDYELDIRFIITTTKNLSKLVGASRFYRALYVYISNTQIHLPPLRERREDIRRVVEIFSEDYAQANSSQLCSFTPEALEKMQTNYWTQNLSEMKQTLEFVLQRAQTSLIDVDDLALGEKRVGPNIQEEDDDGLKLMSLKDAEKLLIKKALIHTSENRTQAAKILGVSIRTLRNKINEYRNDGSNYFVNLR